MKAKEDGGKKEKKNLNPQFDRCSSQNDVPDSVMNLVLHFAVHKCMHLHFFHRHERPILLSQL